MNHCVPDSKMDDDYSLPTSSNLTRPKKSAMGEEEIMELLWKNGQLVVQTQNLRSLKKSQIGEPEQSSGIEIRSEEQTTPQLFMQEDEMASWLHYPLDDSSFDRDFYADLLYPPPSGHVSVPAVSEVSLAEVRPPPPSVAPARRLETESPSQRYPNFLHFSRPKGRMESGPSNSSKAGRESTVVESNETPTMGPESRVSHVADNRAQVSGGNIGCGTMSDPAPAAGTSSAARELAMYELTVSSSPGGSGASASAEQLQKPPTTTDREDLKRKGREADDNECHSEDVEFESADAKKQVRGSKSTKRSRAAEVHNLSERRRRDRINEKMKALQELIPRCNKSDKASMLDEAIEYLKSLQMQVQMMSMGCSMVPVMFPGVQQYMPTMGMGMGMGMGMAMGMGMDMGMNRPMVPFPSVLPGSALQNPAAAAHMGQRFPMPGFHMPPIAISDPSRIQATNQSDPMLNSLASQNPNQPRIPHFADPYQQYLGIHQTQLPLPQNQAVPQPSTTKLGSSREVGNPENRQSG